MYWSVLVRIYHTPCISYTVYIIHCVWHYTLPWPTSPPPASSSLSASSRCSLWRDRWVSGEHYGEHYGVWWTRQDQDAAVMLHAKSHHCHYHRVTCKEASSSSSLSSSSWSCFNVWCKGTARHYCHHHLMFPAKREWVWFCLFQRRIKVFSIRKVWAMSRVCFLEENWCWICEDL